MKFTKATWAFTTLSLIAPLALSQSTPKFDKTTDCRTLPNRTIESDCAQANIGLHIFHLQYVTQQNDGNEILVAIRNSMDPSTKMFLISSTSDIIAYTYPAEADRIGEIIHALDRLRPSFRITYTFTDADSGDKTFPQASVVVNAGQDVVLKRGDKVPVVTESSKIDADTPTHPVTTYVDVGLLVDTTVSGIVGHGVALKYRLDQSSLADATNAAGPTIHQTTLNGVTTIPIGKTTAIGTIELPGTKHRVVISAMAEEVQ